MKINIFLKGLKMKTFDLNVVCGGCGCMWPKFKKMFATAWSGVYWCGQPKCAHKIMRRESERMKKKDLFYE